MKRTDLAPLPAFERPSMGRSRNMAAIKSTGTKPELIVRRMLHAAGFRFRLHRKDVPGRPDLILPRYRIAVFVHGCFWHAHGCKLDHSPRTNSPYWTAKIARNVERDNRNHNALIESGWKEAIIWECSVEEQARQLINELNKTRALATHGAISGRIG